MSDASITAVYLELEEPQSNLAAEARFCLVAFRKRPPDTTCHHPVVDFGRPRRIGNATHLDCVCLCCDLRWVSVKVHEPVKPSDRKAAEDGE